MSKATIYVAAGLFSGRETLFNAELVRRLEQVGYITRFPQRDGFEFGHLNEALQDELPAGQVASAVNAIIYFLDMGMFLPSCDLVVANLDEPLDEGVLVEITHARAIGKPVIGFRTDQRSPFGRLDEALGGIHFFAAYQCNVLIRQAMESKSVDAGQQELDRLVEQIDRSAAKLVEEGCSAGDAARSIARGAELLFDGSKDIHSAESLAAIAQRYVKHAQELNELGPSLKDSVEDELRATSLSGAAV